MPKNETKKVPISKSAFKSILKLKNKTKKDVYSDFNTCSERTLTRCLKNGKIQPLFLDQIALYLDVHPKLLSDPNYINRIDEDTLNMYPYSTKSLEEARLKDIEENLGTIFSLFNVSLAQFNNLDFETQYNLQHELFESIYEILNKYFSADGYGNKGVSDYIINDLENYREDHYITEYADVILRERYIQKPPLGLTASKIKKMSVSDLIGLDISIQDGTYGNHKAKRENPFDKKYQND